MPKPETKEKADDIQIFDRCKKEYILFDLRHMSG